MKRRYGTVAIWLAVWLLAAALFSIPGAWAKPTTPEQAQTAVLNWLGLDAVPLGATLGRQIKEVQTFNYGDTPAYYVVYLNPAGLVFLPADDLVEPIIGFLPGGVYDPSPANPLGALVSQDIPGRVLQARAVEAKGPEALAPATPQAQAQQKWSLLLKPAGPKASDFGVPTISDVRVASFVQSRWSQSTVPGYGNCYNYYTPYNYVCGCVATAMSQLMRYHRHPATGIGVNNFYIWVDGNLQWWNTRGGNGSGGAYNWDSMGLVPSSGVTETQRQAIGALTYDAGLSVHMSYTSGSSGAYTEDAAAAFVNTFLYSNAVYYSPGSNIPDNTRNLMVNPNLHARYPILFGITRDGGHAIVCDGYGYNSSTMYHHLNLGWAGADDAWYNLPTIDTTYYNFNSVYKCIYNVYPTGSGEIIAGRVTSDGSPLSGATVSATGGYSTTTDANGIYALAKVTFNTAFTVTASKTGYTSSSQAVTTGRSQNTDANTGNRWPIDFALAAAPVIPLSQALDNTQRSFSTSGNANWYGEDATWYYGGSAAQSGAITHLQSTRLQTTVVGPGTLTFYWKVSSEASFDYLDLLIDSTNTNWISGEVGWTKVTKIIPAGIHTITWLYSKDGSTTSGSDCGWVDKVVYQQGGRLGGVLPLLLMQ